MAQLTARLSALPDVDLRRVTVGDDPEGTQLGTAMTRALAAEPEARVAGIIAVTDGQAPEAGSPAYYTHVDYQITRNDDDYLSVLLSNRQFLGNSEAESWTAVVFALSGVYEGQPLSLTQAMGLEQSDGDAASDISYASTLVYGLVWQIIQEQVSMGQIDYDPDLTREELQTVFFPESDFYMDENGNFVFYIQAGAIAGEVNGILTYPFSLAELLSAVTP